MAITGRTELGTVRAEQRALRRDVIRWLGNPWLFFGLIVGGGVLSWVVPPVPLAVGFVLAVAVLLALGVAGRRSLERAERAG